MLDIIRQRLRGVCTCCRPNAFNYMAHKPGHRSPHGFPWRYGTFHFLHTHIPTWSSASAAAKEREKKNLVSFKFVRVHISAKDVCCTNGCVCTINEAGEHVCWPSDKQESVAFFQKPRAAANTKSVASPLSFLIGINGPCRTDALVCRVDQITPSHIIPLSRSEFSNAAHK